MLPDNYTTAIVPLTPEIAIQRAKAAYQIVKEMRESVLVVNVDYGAIPGTDKPTLLKPGAEKMCRAFNYCPVFEPVSRVERWEADNPLFFYEIRCTLIRIEDGAQMTTAIGSCNSMENKYRWRWVDEEEVPPYLDKATLKVRYSTRSEYAFAIEKAETGGQYGKPAAYWNEWKQAIENGRARPVKRKTGKGVEMDAWEMGSAVYRVPNDEVFSLVNTIEKMAVKRALVAAVLIGTNASEFFTQDMEDLRDFSDVVEGEFEVINNAPPAAPNPPADAAPAPQASTTAPQTPEKPAYGVTPLPVVTHWTEAEWKDFKKLLNPYFSDHHKKQHFIEQNVSKRFHPGQQTPDEAFQALGLKTAVLNPE